MIDFRSRGLVISLKLYAAVALVAAAILSPLALSFVPVLLLVWYLYLWRWPISAVVNLLTEYFMFFAIALMFTSPVGPFFSILISLPLLFLVNHQLGETADTLDYQDSRYRRSPTNVCMALVVVSIVVMGVAGMVGNLALLLAGAVGLCYLGILCLMVLRRLALKPVEEIPVRHRMVAGSEGRLRIELSTRTKIGGLLFIESPYQWLSVRPNVLSLKEDNPATVVSLSPALSGPSVIKLNAQATDHRGLIRVSFKLAPIDLYVIPRAKYAAWLARKYLTETKPGTLPLVSNLAALKPIYGLRRGVEYYGSQSYQPGDSLRSIDWKHSLKYNELITKEFAEFHGRAAIMLINLAAGDEEEADRLAYKIIVTAMSLAQADIPAALAVYNHEEVKLTTSVLQPQQLVLKALQITRGMVTFINPVKYLNPPDVARLRANINRIRFVESEASATLAQLLRLEYDNLNSNARQNPATKALSEVLSRVDKRSSIVVISHHNHDAEAIAFNTFNLARKGNAVITV